jgi:hypothetical protein
MYRLNPDTDVLKAVSYLRRQGQLPGFFTWEGKTVFLPDIRIVKLVVYAGSMGYRDAYEVDSERYHRYLLEPMCSRCGKHPSEGHGYQTRDFKPAEPCKGTWDLEPKYSIEELNALPHQVNIGGEGISDDFYFPSREDADDFILRWKTEVINWNMYTAK